MDHPSSMLLLQATRKFSVLSLADSPVKLNEADEFGDDIPLDDTSLQVLLESLNLTPASATLKVPTINEVPLPFSLISTNITECSLLIEQDTEVSKMGQGGTGGIIWESSKACTQFIVHHYGLSHEYDGDSRDHVALPHLVIEIGSGTGLLGIATATLFHDRRQHRRNTGLNDDASLPTSFILTDQRNVVPLLQRNLDRNSENGEKYNMNDINTFAVDWNIESDRNKLILEIQQSAKNIASMSKSDASVEVLMLCSDLVFGNNYEHLIDLMEAIQLLFVNISKEAQLAETPNTAMKHKLQYHCELLFCFEEREDRFPSPGFHQRLEEVFHIVKPRSLPEDFTDLYPRIDISWLRIPLATI